jgi:hypothetical protein
MNLTYGHRVRSHDDEYFAMTERFQDFLRDASRPSLLDISPVCEYPELLFKHLNLQFMSMSRQSINCPPGSLVQVSNDILSVSRTVLEMCRHLTRSTNP